MHTRFALALLTVVTSSRAMASSTAGMCRVARLAMVPSRLGGAAATTARGLTTMAASPPVFLGRSDDVPRLGLGLAALGRPGYINLGRDADIAAAEARRGSAGKELMKTRAFECLDAAWGAGVRYYDCARSYGASEEFLSAWLVSRKIPPTEVVVGSKWGYRYVADFEVALEPGAPHEVKDHSLAHLTSQWEESDVLLGNTLDLYQIHSATLDSGVLGDESVLAKLQELKESRGLKIGLSLSGVLQAKTLKVAVDTGLFDSVQATYNLMESSVGPALERAHLEHGFDVIVKEGMANGRVLQNSQLLAAAKKLEVPPDALALASIIAEPFNPMVLSGAVTPAQVESNVKAVELADVLRANPALHADIRSACKVEPEAYWDERSALAWN